MMQRAVNAAGDGVMWLFARQWRYITLGVLVLVTLAYCGGRSAGRRSERLEQLAAQKKANTARLKAADQAREIAHTVTVAAVAKSETARRTFVAVRSHVAVVSDSQVSIDHGPPIDVPMPVVSVIHSADAKINADSITMAKMQRELATCGEQNAALLERVDILEAQLATIKPPKCGAKCGAAAATALIVGLFALLH